MTSHPHSQPDMREVLDFLNSIEGAGYGGMASFEIARRYVQEAVQRSGVQSRDAIKALSEMFSESVHETWTKDEIVNILEDAIRMGSPSLPSADRLSEACNECQNTGWCHGQGWCQKSGTALSSTHSPCAMPCDCGGGVKCTVTSHPRARED